MQTAVANSAAPQNPILRTPGDAADAAAGFPEGEFRTLLTDGDVAWADDGGAPEGESPRAEEHDGASEGDGREQRSEAAASVVTVVAPVDSCAVPAEAAGDVCEALESRSGSRAVLTIALDRAGEAVRAARREAAAEAQTQDADLPDGECREAASAGEPMTGEGQSERAEADGADETLSEEYLPALPPAGEGNEAATDVFAPRDEIEFFRLADTLNLLPVDGAATAEPRAEDRLNEGRFLDSVLRQCRLLARPDGAREMRLRLDPPELGAVELRLRLRGDRLQAVIRVEDAGAAGQIRNLVPRMRALVAAEGLSVERLTVELSPLSNSAVRSLFPRERGGEARGMFRGADGAPARRTAALCLEPVGAMDFLA